MWDTRPLSLSLRHSRAILSSAMSFQYDSPGAEERALARIRAAAGETLAAWPEARAAVLFGSRARGDHRPDSDWDIAFITTKGEQESKKMPPGLPISGLPREEGLKVDCLTLPEPVARRKACAIGHVASGVVRDGRLLAGSWERFPSPGGEAPRMQPDEYSNLTWNALGLMECAVLEAENLGKTGRWQKDDCACSKFVRITAKAAEHLAKAMLGRHGIDYRHLRGLSRLEGLARQAGRDDLAGAIGSMNGNTPAHHLAPNGGGTAKDCRQAVGRFLAMAPLLADEITAGERDDRLAAAWNAGGRRPAALNMARERQAGLRAASDNTPGEVPEDFIRERIAVLAGARLALADALAGLEESLLSEPVPDPLKPPSPFED